MPKNFHLVLKKGPGPGQAFSLETDEITIGRDITCDISIIEKSLSRQHARLFVQDGEYYLEDTQSTNGTFIDGVRLTAPQLLKPGTVFNLGANIEFSFEALKNKLEETAVFPANMMKSVVQDKRATKVFVSYSRRNKPFVEKLHASLVGEGFQTWVDWEGIPLTADWWAEIETAIEGADGFVFVISPDSLASEVCAKELNAAIEHNKRLIPILHVEPEKGQEIPDQISSHNWVFMKDESGLKEMLPKLVESINTDLEWVKAHTRLLVRAVEWLGADRRASLLLRGADLEQAERMHAESQLGKEPALNPQQMDYIRSSRQEARRARTRLIAGISVTAVITLLLILSVVQTIRAQSQQRIANEQREIAEEQQAFAEEQRTIAEENAAEAKRQEQIAKDQKAIAQANEAEAKEQREIAVEQSALATERKRLALARGISAQAQVAADTFPPRTLLLAAQAFNTMADAGDAPLPISEEILRKAIAEAGGMPMAGHTEAVTAVAANYDGSLIASGDRFGNVHLWYPQDPDFEGYYYLYSFTDDAGNPVQVKDIALSQDGRWLAAGSEDGQLALWDFFLDEWYNEPTWLKPHDYGLTQVVFSPNSRWLASGGKDGLITLLDLLDPDFAESFQSFFAGEDESGTNALAFSPLGNVLATGHDSGEIYLWTIPLERPDQQYRRLERVHDAAVLVLEFNRTGDWLVSGSHDDTAVLWNIQGGASYYNIPLVDRKYEPVHANSVVDVAFDSDSKYLVTGDINGEIYRWFLDGDPTNDPLRLRGHKGRITDLAFSVDDAFAISSSRDGTIRMWPMQAEDIEDETMVLRGHAGAVSEFALSQDGHFMVSASEDMMLRLWDVTLPNPGAGFGKLSAHVDWVRAVAFSPDNRWIATGGDDSLIYLWDLQEGIPGSNSYVLEGHFDWVQDLAFSPDGSLLASASDDGRIGLWNMNAVETGAIFLEGHGDYEYVYHLAFSPEGEWLASGDINGTMILWNIDDLTKEESRVFRTDSEITDLDFSKDGRWLAVSNWSSEVLLIDLENGFSESQLSHNDAVLAVAFSPDGRWLATGGVDGSVALWFANDDGFELLSVLNEHEDWVRDVVFSPDSQLLVSGSDDSTAILWNISAIASRKDTKNFTVLLGHTDWINRVAFSPDGGRIATGSDDATIRIWDPNSSDPSNESIVLRGHENFILDIAFSSDSDWLVSGSADWDARLWPLSKDSLLSIACSSAGRNLTQEEWNQFVASDEPYEVTCDAFPALGLTAEQFLLNSAYDKLYAGDIAGAVADFDAAKALDEELLSAYEYNAICWFGGVWNQPELVIESCDLAVELAPDDGNITDSRGLVRALLGDLAGAAEDFRHAVNWAIESGFGDDPFTLERTEWAEQLEAGINPFDEALLESLRP